ncbi:MAG: hypothetical protein ACJ75J_17675 [Cytophagaceae bacterium]
MKKLIIIGFAVLSLGQFGCKEKKFIPGPQGPAGNGDPNTGLVTNGSYIKGTIKTLQNNGVDSITIPFNNMYMDTYPLYTLNNGSLDAYLYKNFVGYRNDDHTDLNIFIDSLNQPVPNIVNFMVGTETEIGTDSIYEFDVYQQSITLNSYSFDEVTNTASGTFSYTTSSTNLGYNALVSGSFKLVGVRVLMGNSSSALVQAQ